MPHAVIFSNRLRRMAAQAACALCTASATFLPTGVVAATGAATASTWQAAWLAPHSDAFASVAAHDQTLRQVIAPHASGSAVRLRLSNRFGTQPVVVGAVSIGASEGGAALAGAGALPLRFDGQPGVTLAPGESRLSDPVALSVQAMQRLAVSVHVRSAMLSGSRHFNANEWVWRARGDQTRRLDGEPFERIASTLVASSVLIEALEVQSARPAQRVVVAFGDSITDGFVSTAGLALLPSSEPIGRDVRYPDFLQRRLLAAGAPVTVVNAAISGNRLLAGPFIPMFGPSGLSRFERDVLGTAGATDVLVLIGINDLGFALWPGPTGEQLRLGLAQLVQRAHAAGLRVTLGTLMPARGANFGLAHGSVGVEQARQKLNAWIRGAGVADAVVDFDACMRDPLRPDRLRADYDSGDHLHPNAKGYQAMSECVDLARLR